MSDYEMKSWEDQDISERVETSIKGIEKEKQRVFPDGIPMNLKNTDIDLYRISQIFEAQLAVLGALKR